ncbi:MAG: hypothetical protein KF780_07920 [Sphingomonas sp.]|nr:hypothetical protein [Sphingomonas sp.]
MPKGSHGEKHPADTIGRAVMIGKIEDERDPIRSAAAELGSRGGQARARKLTREERSRIAKNAANRRWGKAYLEPESVK